MKRVIHFFYGKKKLHSNAKITRVQSNWLRGETFPIHILKAKYMLSIHIKISESKSKLTNQTLNHLWKGLYMFMMSLHLILKIAFTDKQLKSQTYIYFYSNRHNKAVKQLMDISQSSFKMLITRSIMAILCY